MTLLDTILVAWLLIGSGVFLYTNEEKERIMLVVFTFLNSVIVILGCLTEEVLPWMKV